MEHSPHYPLNAGTQLSHTKETVMTADQIKEKFRSEGKTFSGWAREHGYAPIRVIRVLNGFDKGHYGQAHEIAVKLGLKPAPKSN